MAIRFASWLDEDFAIWCDCIIEDILTKKAELVITKPETSTTVQVSQSLPPGFMLAVQQLAQDTNSESMHLNSRPRTSYSKGHWMCYHQAR